MRFRPTKDGSKITADRLETYIIVAGIKLMMDNTEVSAETRELAKDMIEDIERGME